MTKVSHPRRRRTPLRHPTRKPVGIWDHPWLADETALTREEVRRARRNGSSRVSDTGVHE